MWWIGPLLLVGAFVAYAVIWNAYCRWRLRDRE